MGAVAGRAGFGRGPRSEAAARERIETLFNFLFSKKFQIAVFKYPFEQENDFFLKWTKNKNCLELNPLQLFFYDQSPILARF